MANVLGCVFFAGRVVVNDKKKKMKDNSYAEQLPGEIISWLLLLFVSLFFFFFYE